MKHLALLFFAASPALADPAITLAHMSDTPCVTLLYQDGAFGFVQVAQ